MYRWFMSTAVVLLLVTGLLIARAVRPQDAGKPGSSAGDKDRNDSKAKDNSAPALPPLPEALRKGAVAPDFTLADLKGNPVQLSSFKGKAVVINFWATWCEPCKVEMPWLVDLQKKYGSQGLQILGVAMDDADDATIHEFAVKMGVNYPVLKGTEAVADLYGGLEGLPATFFVDRSGKIADQVIGLMSKSVIEGAIKQALEQTRASSAPPTGEK
jgi:peroxiredoxin